MGEGDWLRMIAGLFNTYQEYVLSDIWVEKSKEVKYLKGNCCEVCGRKTTYPKKIFFREKKKAFDVYQSKEILIAPLSSTSNVCVLFPLMGYIKSKKIYYVEYVNRLSLDVHHKTYERVGNEPLKDLMVVCKECHRKIHKK